MRFLRSVGWRLGLALALLLVSAFAFLQLTEDYVEGEWLLTADRGVAGWLREHRSDFLTDLLDIVGRAGSVTFLLAVVLAGSVFLTLRRRLADGVLLALAFFGMLALGAALKSGFRRDRPQFGEGLEGEGFSFPSAHASLSAAVYGALALGLLPQLDSRRARAALLAGIAALVATIAFSRLYLGAHFLSDVLAGVCAGLAWLAACVVALDAYRRRRGLRQSSG